MLLSCSKKDTLNKYYQIVGSADKIIFYARAADTFAVTKNIDSLEHLQNIKHILKRHVQPEVQRKFIAQYKIEIYNHGKLSGALLISGRKENPFVNFTNDKFGFGFKLTYGIGMSL